MVNNKQEIFSILDDIKDTLKSMGIKRMGLFGSFARDESTDQSDVDIIVSFLPGYKNYDTFFRLAELLEEHFDRKVELITEESVSPYIKTEIDKEIGYYEVAA
jgi:uncharacterized protein